MGCAWKLSSVSPGSNKTSNPHQDGMTQCRLHRGLPLRLSYFSKKLSTSVIVAVMR